MKKMDIPINLCMVKAFTPIENPDEIVLSDEILQHSECVRKQGDFIENPKTDFSMKIGGTVFDVTTHFNVEGRQSVLQQFKDLILATQAT